MSVHPWVSTAMHRSHCLQDQNLRDPHIYTCWGLLWWTIPFGKWKILSWSCTGLTAGKVRTLETMFSTAVCVFWQKGSWKKSIRYINLASLKPRRIQGTNSMFPQMRTVLNRLWVLPKFKLKPEKINLLHLFASFWIYKKTDQKIDFCC